MRIVPGEGDALQSGLPFERFMHDTSGFKINASISEKNQERVLTIVSELNPEIKSSMIYYDPVTYRIKKAEIEWWKDAVIEKKSQKQIKEFG